jgi:serine/threonine protein kinase
MANVDAATLADKAFRIGLVTQEQLEEGWNEVGKRGSDPEPLLLVLERKGYLTPWQSQKLLKGDPDGFFLGGYRILYKIASGTFGRVYRADDPRTGTVVAIKVLRRKWSEDKHNTNLFEREGRLGMSLKHPNIVEILAVNQDPVTRQYFIVMEFVEGGNLRDILNIRKKLEAPEALRFLEETAAGLAYAYSLGVTHRDMKMTNILISSSGQSKLVDFGLAGIYSGRVFGLDNQEVDRTVDYAGLEKATGAPAGDTRSDIYFLGTVAYEMLTGRAPLDKTKDPRVRMSKERYLKVKPMGKDEVNAPPSVFHLVETMMAYQPSQRYQTPSQVVDAIREVRQELSPKPQGGPSARCIFVVEKDEKLQDVLRSRLKEEGFRVLISADPVRALDRYRQQPFDLFILDARTSSSDGLLVLERIMSRSEQENLFCAAIVLLGEDQADWARQIKPSPKVALLTNPTFKQLRTKIDELMAQRT